MCKWLYYAENTLFKCIYYEVCMAIFQMRTLTRASEEASEWGSPLVLSVFHNETHPPMLEPELFNVTEFSYR